MVPNFYTSLNNLSINPEGRILNFIVGLFRVENKYRCLFASVHCLATTAQTLTLAIPEVALAYILVSYNLTSSSPYAMNVERSNAIWLSTRLGLLDVSLCSDRHSAATNPSFNFHDGSEVHGSTQSGVCISAWHAYASAVHHYITITVALISM